MTRKTQLASLVLLLGFLWTPGRVQADSGIRNQWLNTYPSACQTLKDAANDCTLCHQGQHVGILRGHLRQHLRAIRMCLLGRYLPVRKDLSD